MKFVRAAVIVVFVVAMGIFGVSVVKEILNHDSTMPVLTSDRDVLEIPCAYTQEQLLEGLTASDEADGDLTDQILVGSMTRFVEKGVCSINYVVFDSSNQAAELTRKISFTDYKSPEFTLSQPLVYTKEYGSYKETMGRIGVTDMLDGNLKEWIVQTESDVNYYKEGTYHITLEVSNSFGDTVSVSFPVHVVDNEAAAVDIQLVQPLVYVDKDGEFSPGEWIAGVTGPNGESLGKNIVSTDSQVDVSTPGTYEVHYTAQDENENTGETWLTVIVRE